MFTCFSFKIYINILYIFHTFYYILQKKIWMTNFNGIIIFLGHFS